MTLPTGETTSSRASGSTTATGSRSQPVTGPGERFLVLAAPLLVTFVGALWGITGPSYWRDEAATLVAVQRPFGQLLRMLGNIDAVHGAIEPVAVAHVADKIAHAGIPLFIKLLTHIELLQLVPTKNDEFSRSMVFEHGGEKLLTERTGSPGDQNDFVSN